MGLLYEIRKSRKKTWSQTFRSSVIRVFGEENLYDDDYRKAIKHGIKLDHLAIRKFFNLLKIFVEFPLTILLDAYDRACEIGATKNKKQYGFGRSTLRLLGKVLIGLPLYLVKHVSSPINYFIRPIWQDIKKNPKFSIIATTLVVLLTAAFIAASVFTGGFTVLGIPFILHLTTSTAALVGTVAAKLSSISLSGYFSVALATIGVTIGVSFARSLGTYKFGVEIKKIFRTILSCFKGEIGQPSNTQKIIAEQDQRNTIHRQSIFLPLPLKQDDFEKYQKHVRSHEYFNTPHPSLHFHPKDIGHCKAAKGAWYGFRGFFMANTYSVKEIPESKNLSSKKNKIFQKK